MVRNIAHIKFFFLCKCLEHIPAITSCVTININIVFFSRVFVLVVLVSHTDRFHNSSIHPSVTARVPPGQASPSSPGRPLDTPVVKCSPPQTASRRGAAVTVEGVGLRNQHLEAPFHKLCHYSAQVLLPQAGSGHTGNEQIKLLHIENWEKLGCECSSTFFGCFDDIYRFWLN